MMNTVDRSIKLDFRVSVCICTRNRPDDLKKALESIQKSTYQAFETIVSDDSTNEETRQLVKAQFPWVHFLEGPRKGLGANRNNALRAISGSHVLFVDDDVVLSQNFLELIYQKLQSQAQEGTIDKIIVSGIENKNGDLVFPGEQSFLGYQNVRYQTGDEYRTVVINSAVFPVEIFRDVQFDERLVYGNDEVDFTTQATRKGYKILLYPEAVNFHYPSEINRDFYEPYHDSTRIYVTFKRYFYTEKEKIKGLAYLPYAYLYAAARNFKYRGFSSIPDTLDVVKRSSEFIFDYLKSKKQ